jgi:PHD/YefM family antitoxin component YafN of YafNO toxin-antitoxin module
MASTIRDLQAQYVTDENGKKTAVILPIEEFEELLEDIEDLAVLLERRDERAIPFDKVVAKLKQDGNLLD